MFIEMWNRWHIANVWPQNYEIGYFRANFSRHLTTSNAICVINYYVKFYNNHKIRII